MTDVSDALPPPQAEAPAVAVEPQAAPPVAEAIEVSLPPDCLPLDILHVSDTHFRTWTRWNKQRREDWRLFLESVAESVEKGDFSPAFVAFTGDLIESPGLGTSARAYRQGIYALLQLAHVCGWVPKPAPVEGWNGQLPDAWRAVLNKRLFVIPGNHDVFVKGLRMGFQRWPRAWHRAMGSASSDPTLIADGSHHVGPLAMRMIDSNGGRAFGKRARGVYAPGDGGAARWPFSTEGRFGVALMHGHPLQLPYLIRGLSSEAGMMVDNSAQLLRDLAALDIRLVLHGHRHLPNVCGVLVQTDDGRTHNLSVVAAGSVTVPAWKQWPYYSFNWIRIDADRRVSVYVMRRQAGQTQFFIDGKRPIVADRGDFEYDRVTKYVEVTPFGDEYGRVIIKGLRVRPDRPAVGSFPFQLEYAAGASLAATRFSASTGQKPDPSITWDRDAGVLRLDPAQTVEADPLDVELHYCLHNSSPLSQWEARELQLPATKSDVISHRTTCSIRHVEMSVQFPPVLGMLKDSDLSTTPSSEIEWDTSTRLLKRAAIRPEPGSKIVLQWMLPVGEPTAADESKIQPMRHWQAWVAKEHKAGKRVLDLACEQIAQALQDDGYGPLDVGVFLVCTEEVRRLPACAGVPRMLLVGEWTGDAMASAPATPAAPKALFELPYGQGVVGRAVRTGLLVHYQRLVAEETKRKFERGEQNSMPENYYSPLIANRHYDVVVAVPLPFLEFGEAAVAEPVPPQRNLLVGCIASNDPASPLVQVNSSTMVQLLADVSSQVRQSLWDFAYDDATTLAEKRKA